MAKGSREKKTPQCESAHSSARAERRSGSDKGNLDCSSVESSKYNISLDDLSSIHSSDYSQSSADEKSVLRSVATIDDSLLSRLTLEVINSINKSVTSEMGRANSTGSSSSSTGSPWVDETDSSSSESSNSLPSQWANRPGKHKFDAARNRMIEQQRHHRTQSPATRSRRNPRDESPSSVRSGMDPSKPIDVTGALDLPTSHHMLEQVRQARLLKATRSSGRDVGNSLVCTRPTASATARIVGIVSKGQETKRADTKSDQIPSMQLSPRVSRVLVPVSRPDHDNLSSICGTVGDFRPSFQHERPHSFLSNDMECGIRQVDRKKRKLQDCTDSNNTKGWIEQRSDLELCLMCLVVSSSATLAILVVFMLLYKDQ